MPKHPVPKKKTAKSTTKTRYSAYEKKQQTKLEKRVHLIKCADCGAAKMLHHVCSECGKYKGRQVVDQSKKVDKITTVKA